MNISLFLRRSALVVLRAAATLLLLAFCLHFVFLWDRVWLTLLWVLAAGVLASAVYCRKWMLLPVIAAVTVAVLPVALLVVWLLGADRLFAPSWLIPVAALLGAQSLYVARHALSDYALNRRQSRSLYEYLRANGATELEAQRPFVVRSLGRAYTPVLSKALLAGIVFVPSLLCGLLMGGVPPLRAAWTVAVVTVGAQCSALLAFAAALYIYYKLSR